MNEAAGAMLAQAERLLAAGRADEVERLLAPLLGQRADDAATWRLAGLAALGRGAPDIAFQRLSHALRLAPEHGDNWLAVGRLYLALGQTEDAAQAYRQALARDERLEEGWHGLAALHEARGDRASQLRTYEAAIARVPDRAGLHAGYAAGLLSTDRSGDAERQARQAVEIDPRHAPAWRVLGEACAAQSRMPDAVDAFRRSLALDAGSAGTHYNLGLALEASGDRAGAAAAMQAALDRDGELWPALAQLVFLRRQLCDWRDLDALSARLIDAARSGRPGLTPFSFLSEPATPADQLACARGWAGLKLAEADRLRPRLTAPLPSPRAGASDLRIGFVSSGFHNHPTALLVADLIERLRDQPLTTFGFATHPDDGGAMRKRLRAAFERFDDLSGLDPVAMASRLRAARLDLVFDLRGYGGGAVSEVFALRVAPVQVNWLAYPGTSGAPFIDYLLTDGYVVPPAERTHCSEAVVRLPHAFQPSDATRAVGEPPSRADCGLPESGFVFASFNNSYKFTPEVFALWMRLLTRVPDSVLWLLGDPAAAFAANLRRQAVAAGVDGDRLRFMAKLPHDAYLTRYRHVDLFLDTWPYGAHTTASDALWAGCPVLALPGRTLASRVGGSLLRTLGLDELIADSPDDYLARAERFATDAEALRAVREKLLAAREASPLFDMPRFARDLTRAVRWMVERSRAGLPPADHDLPAEEPAA